MLEKASGNQKTDQPALKTKQTSKKPVAGGSSAATNRSALKEAIAAQRKARQSPQKALPPRPESAQSTFSEVKTSNTPPKPSAARAMATRPHISSLSSAPVRPAMKPRRPELARPATADPYASRRHAPIDPRSKPAGKIENSPNAMSKSVPTLKQTTGATQIRPRKDSVHGNTKSKPKKLDISKTRTHDPYAAASRSRSNSNESTMHPISEKVHLADTPIASEGPESPASVQLESPTAPAMQQPVFASDEIISHHSPPKHYEENTPPSTQGPVMGIDGSTPSGNVILNDAPKAADPVIIYEDPASSASADVDDGDDEATVVPDGRAARAGRAPDNGEQQLQGPVTITTPMPEHVTDGSALHPVPDSGRAPDTDPAKVEHHPGLSEFEEHESSMRPNIPPSPSNTVIHHRHRQTSMSSTLPQLADTNNNENTVSLSNKASNVPSDSRTSSKPNILGELHTNEPAHRDNKQPNGGLHRRHSSGKKFEPVRPPSDDAGRRHWRRIEQAAQRRSISPNSKDPKVAREMIRKALGRIRSDALDVVGFRKVQGLILHHDEMFTDEDLFDQLLMALLAAMERPPNEKRQPLGRPLDLKTQVLLTIRFMFTHNKKYFSAYYPRAMCGMVAARRNYEHGCHIVSGLEETVDDIAEVCKASEVMDAILDYAVTEERDEQGSRAITLGVFALNSILYHLHVVHTRIPNRLVVRVGGFCGDLLAGSRLDARRMVTMLCINLRGMVTEEKFWEVLGTLRDDSRNLLIYYLSRQ